MSLNLHALANPLISTIHSNELVTLYQSTGNKNIKGNIRPTYAEGILVSAQVQSVGDAALQQMGIEGQNDITRLFYLNSLNLTPSGIVRPLARGGDIFQRTDGTWWLVVAVTDDFSTQSGWVCVRASLQVIKPDFSFSDWWVG